MIGWLNRATHLGLVFIFVMTQICHIFFSPSNALAEDQWSQVNKHLSEFNKYFPEKLREVQANPNPIAIRPDNYMGSPDGGAAAQVRFGAKLVSMLANPFGSCPRAKYVGCYCVEVQPPPICVTRYYQAIEYRFPYTLAEAGAMFQSSLIPSALMKQYQSSLSAIFTPEFLKTVYRENYIWMAEGMRNQGAPSAPPPFSEEAVKYLEQVSRSFQSIPESDRFFAAWSAGQTPMIGYHLAPALDARRYAARFEGAKDLFPGWLFPPIPMSRKICPGAEYNPGGLWTYPLLQPPPWAYKVHQLKMSDIENRAKWFASEAPQNVNISFLPSQPQRMTPFGGPPPHMKYKNKGHFYLEDYTHRGEWIEPTARSHIISNMSQNYLQNQARCYQKELGPGGYLENAKFIPRVFPAHRILSFQDYDDLNEPCLPYNLGPRSQFASFTQGPVFNAQHLGSVGAFLALAAGGYTAGKENPREPLFSEENLGLFSPYGDIEKRDSIHDAYLFLKGNNIEGRSFTNECGSYAIPPLTGDYQGREGYDKGLVVNNPNSEWIGSMWDWVKGVKRELVPGQCYFAELIPGACANFHYGY